MSSLILTTRSADACKRVLSASGEPPRLETFTAVTLPGLVELGLATVAVENSNGYPAQLDRLAANEDPIWAPFVREWHTHKRNGCGEDFHGTRNFEFFRLRGASDLLGHQFQLFQERFVRSIKANGFGDDYSYALAKTLHEMADNIVQHSDFVGKEATGLVGYHSAADYMALTVADLGQGILESLRANPEWHHLGNSKEALIAVVQKGASSRQGQGEGEGFRQLFRSLIDRNSLVRLRTSDASLSMVDVDGRRQASTSSVPPMSGTQVSICCCLRGKAEERQISTCINH